MLKANSLDSLPKHFIIKSISSDGVTLISFTTSLKLDFHTFYDSGLSLNEYSLDKMRSSLNKNLVNSAALDSENSV